MKIINVSSRSEGGQAILSADIIVGNKNYNIWFSVDEAYADLLQLNVNPFIPCSFMIASKIGEDLVIEGEKVDPVLKTNTEKANELLSSWKIGFKKVKLVADTAEVQNLGSSVGLFFSGGVDSFYSLLKKRGNDESEITHLIHISGYDVDLMDRELFDRVLKNITIIAEKSGKKLVIVKSNLRELAQDYLPWKYVFGGCLGSIALFLGKGLRGAYIAASFDGEHPMPWGSHPDLDHFWSTGSTKIFHDGIESNRLEKVKYIVNSPGAELVFDHLRVCYINPKGAYNCGKCEKCLRTLLELRAAKADKKMKTFDVPLSFENLDMLQIKTTRDKSRYVEVLDDIRNRKDDPEMESALNRILNHPTVHNPSLFIQLRTQIGKMDIKYNRGRLDKFLKRQRLI